MKDILKDSLLVAFLFVVVLGFLLWPLSLMESKRRENKKYIGEKVVLGNDTVLVVDAHYGYLVLSNDVDVSMEFFEEYRVK